MQPFVDDDDLHHYPPPILRARAPQAPGTTSNSPLPTQVSSPTTTSIVNTSPFFPDPSAYNLTSPTSPPGSNDNSNAIKTIVEYFFLIMALFILSVLIFRRMFYLRRRDTYERARRAAQSLSPYPRTTGLPTRLSLQSGRSPLHDSYFIALPLPTAAAHSTRRTRAHDIDLEGRRFTSAGAEIDHGGLLRDKDVLPKYEYLGGPPRYTDNSTELHHQSSVGLEDMARSPPTGEDVSPSYVADPETVFSRP